MKRLSKLFFLAVAFACGFAVLFSNTSSAKANALAAPWTVAVTYQNVGTGPATLAVNFYNEGSATPLSFDPLNGGTLAVGAAKSFWIGSVGNVPSGFRGNAVISADEPITATAVQFSQQTGFKMRLLYNGFSASDVSDQYFIATTLLNKFSRTTVFSIQNTENESIQATVRMYDADNSGNLAATITHTIPANSSKFIDMDDPADTGLPASTAIFNGSAIITAVKTSGGAPANIVAAGNEYYTNRNVAASFEGVPISRASNTVYMATGVCQRFGLDTFYAVSNASLSQSATITVEYRNTDGTTKTTDGPYTIGPGQKKSINTCAPNSSANMANFSGSAVITSTGAPIVAIGKAQNSIAAGSANTADVFTAFIGESGGSSEVSLSFVRYANDSEFNAASNTGGSQRTFIAVQNLESTSIKVNVAYKDKNGNTVATQTLTIAAGAKANTNPAAASALGLSGMKSGSFGYYTDGTFGGGVTITAHPDNPSAEFIAIARGQNPGAGEDVNGVQQ